jgi:hypothetical protein
MFRWGIVFICTAFFGIDYFDQSRFVWYALLAMIAAAVAIPATATIPVIDTSSTLEPDGWQAEPEGVESSWMGTH